MADASTPIPPRPAILAIVCRASATHGPRIELRSPAGESVWLSSRDQVPTWFQDLDDDDQQTARHWLDRWAANVTRTAAEGQHHG